MATRRGCASVPVCVMRRPFAVVLGAIVGDLNLQRRHLTLVLVALGFDHVAHRDYAHQAAPDDNRQMPDAHLRYGVRHRLQIVFRRAHDHVLGHQFTHRVAKEMLVQDGPPHDVPFRDDADRPSVLVQAGPPHDVPFRDDADVPWRGGATDREKSWALIRPYYEQTGWLLGADGE